jgi:5-methylcytosine-specific restriction protein A
MLICGPPAAGKSCFVRAHAKSSDSVIDIDMIARECGFGRDRPPDATGKLLRERNERLARLAKADSDHVAWVIVSAASAKLRAWWSKQLAVRDADLILLVAPRAELIRRVCADPDRRFVAELHIKLIDQWLDRERANDPGRIVPGCDANGFPLDPLHPWNDMRS